MKVISNINYGSTKNPNQVLNIYLPEATSFPVYIFFHGGCLEGGEHDFDLLGEYLTSRSVAVVSVQYSTYPNAKYPEFITDAAMAVKWVCDNISQYGECTKKYIGGSSAGAYITMMLCFDKRWLGEYKLSANSFDGFVHDAGQPTVHFNVLKELGIDQRKIVVDERAPLYYICEEKYPPLYFIVADSDLENRYEQILLTVSALKNFGCDDVKLTVMNGEHCHYVEQLDDNSESIYGKLIYDFIK